MTEHHLCSLYVMLKKPWAICGSRENKSGEILINKSQIKNQEQQKALCGDKTSAFG